MALQKKANNSAILSKLDLLILKTLKEDGKCKKCELKRKINCADRHIKNRLEYLGECGLIDIMINFNKDGHISKISEENKEFVNQLIEKFYKI